jgi:hypothetical protein
LISLLVDNGLICLCTLGHPACALPLFLDCGCKGTAFSNTIPEKAPLQQIPKTQVAKNQQLASAF